MFADVAESLRSLLVADMPIIGGEIDIAFDRPTREWSNRLTKPTLNLFLFDIRERPDMRDQAPMVSRTANGSALSQLPPRRIDLSYMVTAWSREPGDEHRILASAMGCTIRRGRIEADHLQGQLRESPVAVLLRPAPPDLHAKPADLWGVLDNELRASITWVATAPLDVYRPVEAPIVRTREAVVRAKDDDWAEGSLRVGGFAYRGTDVLAGAGGLAVGLKGTRHRAVTGDDGAFAFDHVAPGEYELVARDADGATTERRIVVPSESYDISVR
ncbi:MAG: DUF4255 domain-containing protein [Dehalococcoidia bacterium]|nr:DUF4255 domain-containing protein [Dehalococcoidia bacterium]